MFDMLLESGHRPALSPSWGKGVALTLHVLIVAALWRAPLASTEEVPVTVTGLVFPAPAVHDGSTSGPTIPLPPVISDLGPLPAPEVPGIPEGALSSRIAIASGSIQGDPGQTLGSSDRVYSTALGQEAPELLTAPEPVYPSLLRGAGVQGRVVVEAVVDTLGLAENGSVRIVRSSNPGFDAAALATVRAAQFRPARVYGRAVRVLVQVPVDFRLN